MFPRGVKIRAQRAFGNHAKQRGITMVEILVAILVLAIGFLGMASIQLLGAKNIAGSSYRTVATIYAYDMVERMRSNVEGVEGDFYDNIVTAKLTAPKCAADCTVEQIARRDVFEWNQLIGANVSDGGLPEGEGSVSYNSTTDQHEITVSWQNYIRTDDFGSDDDDNNAKRKVTRDDSNDAANQQSFVLAVKLEP